jgi:hypothetical protein
MAHVVAECLASDCPICRGVCEWCDSPYHSMADGCPLAPYPAERAPRLPRVEASSNLSRAMRHPWHAKRDAKRQAKRARRRAEKRDPEWAPTRMRELTRGWAD